jgi:hypothetical protein
MAAQAKKYNYTDDRDGKQYWMNHELTMGENLADLGGLSLALKACHCCELSECYSVLYYFISVILAIIFDIFFFPFYRCSFYLSKVWLQLSLFADSLGFAEAPERPGCLLRGPKLSHLSEVLGQHLEGECTHRQEDQSADCGSARADTVPGQHGQTH